MYCARKLRRRVCHGVDNLWTEWPDILRPQGLGAGGFDTAIRIILAASPENVVFAPTVDADHGPHVVVVWHECHFRCPNDVENSELI